MELEEVLYDRKCIDIVLAIKGFRFTPSLKRYNSRPSLTSSEISKKTDIGQRTVIRHLENDLEREGVVKKALGRKIMGGKNVLTQVWMLTKKFSDGNKCTLYPYYTMHPALSKIYEQIWTNIFCPSTGSS